MGSTNKFNEKGITYWVRVKTFQIIFLNKVKKIFDSVVDKNLFK
jgi:hypothetical protein